MSIANSPKVFGTGMIALDLVMGPEGNTPIGTWAGGTCGNVLSILAFLGWSAFPIARFSKDAASKRVRSDLAECGVHLDFIDCGPSTPTPIIVQKIKKSANGASTHHFSWYCPSCGKVLPTYRAITTSMALELVDSLVEPSVFFLDRLSRGALDLASAAADSGAAIVFEPSGKSNERLLSDAIDIAHIIKYADDRLTEVPGAMTTNSATLLEVQTLGSKGLRYRHRFGRGISKWIHLNAISAPRVTDTCGAGDWCAAGLISKLCASGSQALFESSARSVRRALRFGQALASWNCGFQGARGGMYATSPESVQEYANRLVSGRSKSIETPVAASRIDSMIVCPACTEGF